MGPKGQGMTLLLIAYIGVVAFMCLREWLLIQKAKRQRSVYEKHFGSRVLTVRGQPEHQNQSPAEKGSGNGMELSKTAVRVRGVLERVQKLLEGASEQTIGILDDESHTQQYIDGARSVLADALSHFDDDAKAKQLADDAERFDREQSKLATSGLDDVVDAGDAEKRADDQVLQSSVCVVDELPDDNTVDLADGNPVDTEDDKEGDD